MFAAAGLDGAGPEQAVRAAAAMAAIAAIRAVTALVAVLLSSARRGTRMGRIVTSLPRHPVPGTSSLRAPRLRPASATPAATGTPSHRPGPDRDTSARLGMCHNKRRPLRY